ncbi:PP2C family protein-serine/threonine phosphatase [Paenibacillus sp. MBLB4367]|uniref:PP2C family protein-serine/threonine phosphatase n=1 Tax=Paenibacillus sp. MBLB4367 TaxID=3384767 RepID=UPI003907EBFF
MKEKERGGSLMGRFLGMYMVSAGAGIGIIMFMNVYGLQLGLEELLYDTIPILLVFLLLFVLLLLGFTRYRLRGVIAYMNGKRPDMSASEAFQRMLRFPVEIFWTVMGVAAVFTLLFHLYDYGAEGIALLLRSSADRWYLIFLMMYELSLSQMLAVLLFSGSRASLRPFLLRMNAFSLPNLPGNSFHRSLLLMFVSGVLLSVISLVQTIISKTFNEEALSFSQLLVMAAVTSAFGLCTLMLPLLQFRREIRLLTARLFALQAEKRGVPHQMPIVSMDEIGRLAGAFNELQAYTAKAYEEVSKELRLAAVVQQKLLPPPLTANESYACFAICEQSLETGGDFYDWMELDDRRLAVLVGDVMGKGMPAALIMSSVLALFRLEVRKGGTAGDVLTRLNRRIVETLQGEMMVTAGLALIELDSGRLAYASAGHLAPYIVSAGGDVRELPVASIPLGVDDEESYSQGEYEIAPGDRLILYSDGVVEAQHADGAIYGFDEWERELSETDSGKPLAEQLRMLMDKLPRSAGAEPLDDRTVVCVRWEGRIA